MTGSMGGECDAAAIVEGRDRLLQAGLDVLAECLGIPPMRLPQPTPRYSHITGVSPAYREEFI